MPNTFKEDIQRNPTPAVFVRTLGDSDFVSGDYAAQVVDTAILLYLTGAVNYTVTLPEIEESAGRLYTVLLKTVNAGNTVTIQPNAADVGEPTSYGVLSDTGHYVLLYNTGYHWKVVNYYV